MREGSGLYETIGNDVEGSDAGPKAPEAGNPGPLRRAAALVGHYPRGGGRPVSGGNGASVAPGCPAGSGLLFTVFLIYGLSMTGLYTASTLYHCVNTSVAGRRALRKYDHCSIYLLIAGSYTPVCMVALRQSGGPALLAAVWAVGVVGMVLTVAKLEIPRWLTSAIYLLMGWLAIFAIVPLHRALPAAGFAWLLAGGLLYTVGGVLYAVKWPGRNNPRFGCHEIFHVFILLGSRCAISYSCTK